MKLRSAILFAARAIGSRPGSARGAIAADLTDVGYVDQADVANLPRLRQREPAAGGV